MADPLKILQDVLEKQSTMLKEASEAMSEKTVGNTQTANPLHGPNGLFSVPGLERDIINAYVRPFGIANALPLMPTNTTDPRFGSLTGYTTPTGTATNPASVCADAQVATMKGCTLTARLGVLRFDTNTIDIAKTFLLTNRKEFTDLVLRGRVLGLENLQPSDLDEAGILDVMTRSEMVTAGVSAERELNKQIWQGTLATAGNFPGLDVQVATGQKDAETGTACTSMDSDIKDFAYDLVGGTGRSIVEYLGMLMYYLEYNAMTMGLDPVEFVIAMRPQLWHELSEIWPIVYNTQKASVISSARAQVVIDGRENTRDRDAMRQGMYLDVNGKRYRVILDTGIFERNNINDANLKAGEYASSIYVLPLTIQGNFPVLYREYLDYSMWNPDSALLNGTNTFWTDRGAYTWAVEYNKWCYHLALRTEQRIVLRTPQLAGKIQKVKYVPLQHVRESDPSSPYNFDGGVSLRGYTWGQAVWG